MAASPASSAYLENGAHSVRASAAGEMRSARAFAAAQRHSRLVRALRVALIVGVVGVIAGLAIKTIYRTFGAALPALQVGELSIDGTKITMNHPRLTGARQDGRGYVINAAKAIQDVRRPGQIELAGIDGTIGGADGDTLHVEASSGLYNTGKEAMDLSGVVRLRNSRYTVELKSAHIDFRAGAYSSTDPVNVLIFPASTISSDSASVREGGKEIEFDGHVKSLMRSDGDSDAPIRGNQP